MVVSSHLVHTKIAEARARGALEAPRSDEARTLAELERLLAVLPSVRGTAALRVRTRLLAVERRLASILERTGQGVVADALWDEAPSYDA